MNAEVTAATPARDERSSSSPAPGSATPFDWPAFLLVALPACVLVATRGATRDTFNYLDAFEATVRFPTNPVLYYAEQGVEWGFGVLCWAIHLVGLGWRSLFFVVSLATFYFLALAAASAGLRLRAVLPFYLCTFFITQQLMQVRQGLGMTMAFYVVVDLQRRGLRWQQVAVTLGAVLIHTVALVPVLLALCLRALPGGKAGAFDARHAVLLLLGSVAAARLATHIDVFSAMERLTSYAEDEASHGERGLLQPANLRAGLLLCLFLAMRVPARFRRVYGMLVGLYAAALGIRLGFFDFEILSGRVGSAAGFGEVLALPVVAFAAIRSRVTGGVFTITYFAAQVFVTLAIQLPFMWTDYFTPITRSGGFFLSSP